MSPDPRDIASRLAGKSGVGIVQLSVVGRNEIAMSFGGRQSGMHPVQLRGEQKDGGPRNVQTSFGRCRIVIPNKMMSLIPFECASA